MAQLEVKSLSKSFGNSKILDAINFAVEPGEFLVILGPSGCGKTTLLRVIAGLDKPDTGDIHIGGKDVTDIEPKFRNVAMVFQNYALYPHMTVFENLAFALKIRNIPKNEIRNQVESTAALLDLSGHLQKKPAHLSGGQRQRVALGRAIIRKPNLFLFDEPLSNLDAELRMRMRSELLALHRRIGGTSLYVTHDQIEAMSLADKIVILNKGQQIGPENPRTLYDNPPDTFTASFLGNPGMNLLEGIIDSAGKQIILSDAVQFDVNRQELAGKKVIYGFRPENCFLSDSGQIPVEVIGYEDSGKEYIVELFRPKDERIFCLAKKKPKISERLFLTAETAYLFDHATSKTLTRI